MERADTRENGKTVAYEMRFEFSRLNVAVPGWLANEGPTPLTCRLAQNTNQDIVCIKGLSFPVGNHRGNPVKGEQGRRP